MINGDLITSTCVSQLPKLGCADYSRRVFISDNTVNMLPPIFLTLACMLSNTITPLSFFPPKAQEVWLKNRKSIGWLFEGYVYNREKETSTGIVIRCRQRRYGCKGCAVISKETGEVTVRNADHDHPKPDEKDLDFRHSDDEGGIPSASSNTPKGRNGWKKGSHLPRVNSF